MTTGEKERRTIAVVTGTRAEYGLLRPVMHAIQEHPRLDLAVVVTGMHLLSAFGLTVRIVEEDGMPIRARVPMSGPEDLNSELGQACSVGRGVVGLARALAGFAPDVVLGLGDRTELLAAAIAATYLNIPVAHMHGGDITRGGVDESVRHAVTKLAHLHFPATKGSAERLLRLGEEPSRIHTVGAPALDTILRTPVAPRESIVERLGSVFEEPYVLLVQHSVSTEPEKAEGQIGETLTALERLSMPVCALYPNSDAGHASIVCNLERRASPRFVVQKSIPHRDYLDLLAHAAVIVGNSSSGIIEAASFHTPVVNVGHRQEGRERGANVIDVSHDHAAILKALRQAVSDEFQGRLAGIENPYGGGDTGRRVAEILAEVTLGRDLLQKQITY